MLAAAATVAACEGFKEAMSAHVDVAARAGSQELSSERLAQIIGSTKMPLQKPIFEDFTRVWVSYQLLGYAAARTDSLAERKFIDDAMWPGWLRRVRGVCWSLPRRARRARRPFRPCNGCAGTAAPLHSSRPAPPRRETPPPARATPPYRATPGSRPMPWKVGRCPPVAH